MYCELIFVPTPILAIEKHLRAPVAPKKAGVFWGPIKQPALPRRFLGVSRLRASAPRVTSDFSKKLPRPLLADTNRRSIPSHLHPRQIRHCRRQLPPRLLPLPTNKKKRSTTVRTPAFSPPTSSSSPAKPEAATTTCVDHARKVFGDLQSRRQWTATSK
jgi:hypothetical protein